jgi:hypothetical protein
MPRKKAEVEKKSVVDSEDKVEKKSTIDVEAKVEKAPVKSIDRDRYKYIAISRILTGDKEYKPGEQVNVDHSEIENLCNQNAIELVRD